MSDVKQSTVDAVARQIAKNSNTSSEKAHQIARQQAEKINRERKEQRR